MTGFTQELCESLQEKQESLIEVLQSGWDLLTYFWQTLQSFLDFLLQRFDPSHFQNIILGILAIFIPFAIVLLTDIFNSKERKKSEFEKMVLSDEVLGVKETFWLSIFGIIFFAFFSGVETSLLAKILSIVVAIILIYFFWQSFKKVLRFSEGNKSEFEIAFLQKLRFSKVFTLQNESKAEKIRRSWKSIWEEKSAINEKEFTEVFIAHIDDAIAFEQFGLAGSLVRLYTENIEKRDAFGVGKEILPKVLVWNEILSKKIKDSNFDVHYFLSLSRLVEAIITILLKKQESLCLFESFKKYIEESQKKLGEITDEAEKEDYGCYITELLGTFCPIFFDYIANLDSNSLSDFWMPSSYYFPQDWKITVKNKDKKVAHIIFKEFIAWWNRRLHWISYFSNKPSLEKTEKPDMGVSAVINGLFYKVDLYLFTNFFMLYSYYLKENVAGELEVEYKNFLIAVDHSVDVTRDATLQVILNFFRSSFSRFESDVISIKQAIESQEIQKICESSEEKESRRKAFIELIDALILEIEK